MTHDMEPGEIEAPEIEATGTEATERAGDPRVAGALARLEELGALPVADHVAVFEDVHRQLAGVLGGLDEEQAPGAGRS